jgi:hypothetical protein
VAREVEEAEEGPVAQVEEEVARAGVVTVLDQLDEREAEEPLVEADRLLDVLADERGVVDAAGGGSGPRRPVGEVLLAQLLAAVTDRGELVSGGLGHAWSVAA